jgi:hypothetical protein
LLCNPKPLMKRTNPRSDNRTLFYLAEHFKP